MRKLAFVFSLSMLAAACGGSVVTDDAAVVFDAAVTYDAGATYDADVTPADAAVTYDANTIIDAQPAGPNNRELTPGAGTVTGGVYKVEFQLGHTTSQKKSTGGATSVEGAAAVKP
jgi:hypothetical protein